MSKFNFNEFEKSKRNFEIDKDDCFDNKNHDFWCKKEDRKDYKHDNPWDCLIGKPVAIVTKDCKDFSGILCCIDDDCVVILVFVCKCEFEKKVLPICKVENIIPFPPCRDKCCK